MIEPRTIVNPACIFIFIVLALVCVGIPVLLIRYLRNRGNEQKLLRMELGKLAEEVHLIQQKLKGGEKQEASAEPT